MRPAETLRLGVDHAERAGRLIAAGALVAFPTETVYGLGADATNPEAVAAVFAAKGRPSFNPLICHFAEPGAVLDHVIMDERARLLAGRFWPGPLTLVLARRPESRVCPLAAAGLETLAVRVPAHPVALAILREAGVPVAAPSANRSGRISPTRADHVLDELDGAAAAVVDGGACPIGVESTVIDLSGAGPILLRAGGVAVEAVEAVIGPLARSVASGVVRGPGLLASHYAPRLPLRVGARSVGADEALLAFGPPLAGAGAVWNLSPDGNLTEAAARLFEGMRLLDRSGLSGIAAMPIPETGLGLAINDRLNRAAAPRPGESAPAER